MENPVASVLPDLLVDIQLPEYGVHGDQPKIEQPVYIAPEEEATFVPVNSMPGIGIEVCRLEHLDGLRSGERTR